jgi:hypothetical protein
VIGNYSTIAADAFYSKETVFDSIALNIYVRERTAQKPILVHPEYVI